MSFDIFLCVPADDALGQDAQRLQNDGLGEYRGARSAVERAALGIHMGEYVYGAVFGEPRRGIAGYAYYGSAVVLNGLNGGLHLERFAAVGNKYYDVARYELSA